MRVKPMNVPANLLSTVAQMRLRPMSVPGNITARPDRWFMLFTASVAVHVSRFFCPVSSVA